MESSRNIPSVWAWLKNQEVTCVELLDINNTVRELIDEGTITQLHQ